MAATVITSYRRHLVATAAEIAYNIGTDDVEIAHAIEATSTLVPAEDFRFENVLFRVASLVFEMMARYGDTGFGDKPPEFHRFPYWFQHLDMDMMSEFVESIEHKLEPPPATVLAYANKPPSSQPKCTECKTKIPRGDVMLETRWVSRVLNIRDKEIKWELKIRTRLCATCIGCSDGEELRRAAPRPPLTTSDLEKIRNGGTIPSLEPPTKKRRTILPA